MDFAKIPTIEEPLRYTNLELTNSPFVKLCPNDKIDIQMQYPLLAMEHAEAECFLRLEAFEKLIEASNLLPADYKFLILDAWRPFSLQEEIYVKYQDRIVTQFHLESLSEVERKQFVKQFVSLPENNSQIPPVHTTGGAVDLTIIDADGNELEMGTVFDAFTEKTYTDYYEKHEISFIRNNRRMLYHIMTSVGFTNLPSEWWHYDYGDRFWAYYKSLPAMYDGIFNKKDIVLIGKP